MKRTNKRELILNHSSLKGYNLNKSSAGCAPCLNEALKIDKRIGQRSLNEIKIEEIKNIVNSIFKGSSDDNKEN